LILQENTRHCIKLIKIVTIERIKDGRYSSTFISYSRTRAGISVDTPIRVARYGISSVISIVDDILIEHMRKHYARLYEETYYPITVRDEDYRAKRITAYLNLLQKIVQKQIASLKASAFEKGSELVKYFEMLPEESQLKALYHRMMHLTDTEKQSALQHELRTNIVAGDIDVNIMTKLDKANTGHDQKNYRRNFQMHLPHCAGLLKATSIHRSFSLQD